MVVKKYLIIQMIALVFLVGLILNISAVNYFQQIYIKDNHTLENHIAFFWDKSTLVEDKIADDDILDSYVNYNIYTKTWNEKNPDYAVEYCNLSIYLSPSYANTTLVYNETFINRDVFDGKYFVRLNKGDGYYANVFCKFNGSYPQLLEMPVYLSVVSPTEKCKACQYYEWLSLQRKVIQADTIGTYVSGVLGYIKEFVHLNYKILIALFWVFMIFLAFITTNFIFIGIWWVYSYLKHLANHIE